MLILKYVGLFLFLAAIGIAGARLGSFFGARASETPAQKTLIEARSGDPSKRGGTATVREEFESKPDNPATKQGESNDQPLGHMGSITLQVRNVSSGHAYPLDADLTTEDNLKRLYFPKGGWVDFDDCELDYEYSGTCDDENGRSWEIEGKD